MLSARERKLLQDSKRSRLQAQENSAAYGKGRVERLLNSPALLWLATAIFLTVGGSLLAKNEQCFREAQELEGKYNNFGEELERRSSKVAASVLAASDVDQTKVALALRDGDHQVPGVRGLALDELYSAHAGIWIKNNRDYENATLRVMRYVGRQTDPVYRLAVERSSDLKAGDLPGLRELSQSVLYLAGLENISRNVYPIARRCGTWYSLLRSTIAPDLPLLDIDRAAITRLQELDRTGMLRKPPLPGGL